MIRVLEITQVRDVNIIIQADLQQGSSLFGSDVPVVYMQCNLICFSHFAFFILFPSGRSIIGANSGGDIFTTAS